MTRRFLMLPALAALLILTSVTAAFADDLDAPAIELGASGHAKQQLTITAGSSGAPEGFTVYWMPQSQFDANGGVWPQDMAGVSYATFLSHPTLNTFEGEVTTFKLGANESAIVEIGDLMDESGITSNNKNELAYGTGYVYTAVAVGSAALSSTKEGRTTFAQNCTLTLGYWKTHPEAWPVSSLMLGCVSYSMSELLDILNQPVQGNGLVSLAHQLIAAKLNLLNGADPSAVSAFIADADALIGCLVVPPVGSGYLNPSDTSGDTQGLDDFNNGVTGPGHCGTSPAQPATWGSIKSIFRN